MTGFAIATSLGKRRRSVSTVLARALAGGLLTMMGTLASATAQAGAIYDVKGHLPDLRFSLSAAGGKTVDAAQLHGKTLMLFFGYASCPDICPTTMAQLSEVMRGLGARAANALIVFVSVDPHRDTPEKLQAYVGAFDSHALGLTGTDRQIADLARRYRVAYQIAKPIPGQDNYDVTHSRGVYVFDAAGRARLLASDSASTTELTERVRGLVDAP